jgi:hypothetical protein
MNAGEHRLRVARARLQKQNRFRLLSGSFKCARQQRRRVLAATSEAEVESGDGAVELRLNGRTLGGRD